jgi:hypothetical protein
MTLISYSPFKSQCFSVYIDRELYANKLRISNPFSYYLDGYYNTSCLTSCRLQARIKGGIASLMQNIHFKGLICDKLNNTLKYCQVRHLKIIFLLFLSVEAMGVFTKMYPV